MGRTKHKRMDGYSAACRRAATDQGLDPFVEAARAADLPVQVWQTGGFTMLAAVVGVPLFTVSYESGYIVGQWPDQATYDTGADAAVAMIGDQLSAEEAVALIRGRR